jgi:transcriptional regulator with PAS, ATPase and Fis domain
MPPIRAVFLLVKSGTRPPCVRFFTQSAIANWGTMIQLARKVAESEASSVLSQGESGTGKDLVAKAIHYGSRRADRPFIAINCAAIPATLI